MIVHLLSCRASNLKNRMKSSFASYLPGTIHPFLHIILVQNSSRGKKLNKFCSPNSSDDLCLLFGVKTFFYGSDWTAGALTKKLALRQ